MPQHVRVPVSMLRNFAMETLAASGLGDEEQSIVADSLLFADMRGIATHGVSKLPVYIRRVFAGSLDPKAKPECIRSCGALACIDGHNGFGQVSASFGMRHAIMLALSNGVGVAVVRNSNHFGAAGYFAVMAASRNLVGFALSNANPTMAPWGGARPLIGTNPIAVAVPTGNECLFVLDLACSTVARGKIIEAARLGLPIPAGWALDRDGNPTTDVQEALGGLVAPLGGVKGSALAETVDILSGVLSGAGFLSSVGHLYQGLDRPQGVGHFLAALNIADIMPVEDFKSRMKAFIDQIRSCPPVREGEAVYYPGELELASERRCLREGVPLSDEVLADLDTMAAGIGIVSLSERLRQASGPPSEDRLSAEDRTGGIRPGGSRGR